MSTARSYTPLEPARPATANKDLRTLKSSFNRARRRGYLRENPARDVRQVREPEKPIRALSAEEVRKLIGACPSLRWKALIALAVTTGMRRGELLALRWEDVDLDSRTVWVRNTPGTSRKSRKNRVLALLLEVCSFLHRLPRSGELVFSTRDERPMVNYVGRGFDRIVKKAGIKRCTLHDLRRTFASKLAEAGVSEAVVQKLAGHASITTTVKYYTSVMPECLRAAQAKLPFRDVLSDVSDTYHGPKERAEKKKDKVISLVLCVG